jgi:hypothetical protein
MRSLGLGQGHQRLVVASGCREREIGPCSSSMTAPRDAAVPMRLRISSNARCAAQWGLFWQAERVPPLCAGRGPVGKAAGAIPNRHYVVPASVISFTGIVPMNR